MMDDVLSRIWVDLGNRISGPLSFRLIVQPLMAMVLAVHAGAQDARSGRSPYFWTILNDAAERRELLHEGWKPVARIFALAVVLDIVYQLMVFSWLYPFELLLVAFSLACVPYVVVRGAVNRLIVNAHRRVRP